MKLLSPLYTARVVGTQLERGRIDVAVPGGLPVARAAEVGRAQVGARPRSAREDVDAARRRLIGDARGVDGDVEGIVPLIAIADRRAGGRPGDGGGGLSRADGLGGRDGVGVVVGIAVEVRGDGTVADVEVAPGLIAGDGVRPRRTAGTGSEAGTPVDVIAVVLEVDRVRRIERAGVGRHQGDGVGDVLAERRGISRGRDVIATGSGSPEAVDAQVRALSGRAEPTIRMVRMRLRAFFGFVDMCPQV